MLENVFFWLKRSIRSVRFAGSISFSGLFPPRFLFAAKLLALFFFVYTREKGIVSLIF